VIDTHQKNYRDFLSRNTPDAVVMAILCDFDGDKKRDVVHEVLRNLIKLTQGNHQQLREYIGMLEILATNRNLNLDIQQEYEMLHVEIEKLPSFVMGLEKGIEQGIEKGIEKGMEKGMEKGAKQQACQVARKLLAKGMAAEDVIEITGLSMIELESLNTDKT
jgi:predicted transposase/invertase (TIGR01784 family)